MMLAADWLTDQFAHVQAHMNRWGGAAKSGMWCAVLDFPGWPFVHVNCVMDDFGTLVPVSLTASYGIEVL